MFYRIKQFLSRGRNSVTGATASPEDFKLYSSVNININDEGKDDD